MKRLASSSPEVIQEHETCASRIPTQEEIWNILVDIQANVNKILSKNQQLKKDIKALKESIGFTDEKVASAQKDHEKLSEQANSTSKKVTELNQNLSDLEKRLSTLEYDQRGS